MVNKIHKGDCVDKLKLIEKESVDLIYFDPPFYTMRKHSLTTRDSKKKYEFSDSWESLEDYLFLIRTCLIECKRVLKDTGNIFLHCDKVASHHIRVVMDEVFGINNFQSEIIWSYRRWSNSKKGLLNSHQNIYYYSKTDKFKFNRYYKSYSNTTNIDQILVDREKTSTGKSVYKTDDNGNVVLGKEKKGVPLSDVWEIPYLNPKAKERVGYPTQKPVLLLQEIIKIASDKGDLVIDPFCGSGTTCVAAKSLERNFIGFDISQDAVDITNKRLEEMIITESNLLKKGSDSYSNKKEIYLNILKSIDAIVVQRNSGIDGFLKKHYKNKPVPIKIQKEDEVIKDTISKLLKACKDKEYILKVIILTKEIDINVLKKHSDIRFIESNKLALDKIVF